MVLQDYLVEIHNEHIILGNDAIFQCSIPSFVSDFISIQAWVDNEATAVEVNEVKGKFWKFLPLDSFNSRSVLIYGMCMYYVCQSQNVLHIHLSKAGCV